VPLQNTNLKEAFPFKTEYLHELIWESGTILDGQRKYSLENIFVITDDLNLSFGTIRIRPKGSDGGTTVKNINLILNTNQYTFPFWN
jgi:hypothetical protein